MRKFLSLSLMLGTFAWAASLSLILVPTATAQAANDSDDTGVVTEFGSREAIERSGLSGKALQAAVATYVADRQAEQTGSVATRSGIDISSITDAPNFEQVLVKNTSTWAGLVDYATDVSGNAVVAYLDSRDGSHPNGGFSIYARQSTDGGATWGPEQRIERPSGGGTAMFALNATTDGHGTFYVVWDDFRNIATAETFVSVSRDGGATWNTGKKISGVGGVDTNADIVADATGNAVVVWQAALNQHVYASRSGDFGETWSAATSLDSAGAGFDESVPNVTYIREGELIAGWETTRFGGQDFMTATSFDGGATWNTNKRLSPEPVGGTTIHAADVCSDFNGHVYTFVGRGDGTYYARTSSDFGRTFGSPVELTGAGFTKLAAPASAASCAFGSTYAMLAFEGGTVAGAGDNDVLAVVSTDGGATWSTPTRVNTGVDPEVYEIAEMSVDVDSMGRMMVAWTDERIAGIASGLMDGFFNYSVDGGFTWQSTDFRFTAGNPNTTRDVNILQSTTAAVNPARQGLQTMDRNVFDLVWHDTLAGAPGVYFGSATFESSKTGMARLAGDNRYTTSVAISADAYPTAGTVSAAVFATGENFPDGLAATPLAAQIDGPVLLVTKDTLPAEVAAEFVRIYDGRTDDLPDAYVIGGTAAISDAVSAAIAALDSTVTVKRLAGANRRATSVAVATEIDSLRGSGPSQAIVTTGENFPDALTGGALGGNTGIEPSLMPVLLTNRTSLDADVSAYLSSVAGTLGTVHILGGTAAVADSVATAVDAIIAAVVRHAGADRYGTAAQVARDFYTGPMTPMAFGLASGTNFADALPGGLHSAKMHMPLLLTSPSSLSQPTYDYLVDTQATIDTGYLYGGPVAVDPSVEFEATNLY